MRSATCRRRGPPLPSRAHRTAIFGSPDERGPQIASLLRQVGIHGAVDAIRSRLWSETSAFGLAAQLGELPEPRPAKVPITMVVRDPGDFPGFADEAGRVTGDDAIEVEQRRRLCAAGARELYVAATDDGDAIYCQWLFHHGTDAPLHAVTPNQFPQVAPGDTLVEGAYTFSRYRKLGAMAVGMHQLLVAARDSGASRCLTYVSIDNIPSLRGCANVGFAPDHVRVTRQRLGRRRATFRPPTEQELGIWATAIAPR